MNKTLLLIIVAALFYILGAKFPGIAARIGLV